MIAVVIFVLLVAVILFMAWALIIGNSIALYKTFKARSRARKRKH